MRSWVAVAVGATLAVAGCSSDHDAVDDGCGGSVVTSSLPDWARAGFTPADQAVPHVVGDDGEITAVVFGDPLGTPATEGRSNKILWVAKEATEPGSDLDIHASLAGRSVTADRTVEGGPGPSIIDMPQAGCWTFDLSWSGRHDTMQLYYAR